jgi:hypothetical protein
MKKSGVQRQSRWLNLEKASYGICIRSWEGGSRGERLSLVRGMGVSETEVELRWGTSGSGDILKRLALEIYILTGAGWNVLQWSYSLRYSLY